MASQKQFGRYQIKHEIGRGGMATVYLAHDPRFRRDVALKVLSATLLNDPMLRTRFQREAYAVAALEHPAIVPVYDVGEEEEQPYLVMRHMQGGTLKERLFLQPLSPDEILRILRRIGEGLDLAHEQGIIHRDLKPGNVLFDQYNNPFIADFGIVKISEGMTMTTGTTMVGTPAYMSPEQAQGNGEIDGRSDIYSLGVVLYEMLTGARPYSATTPIGVVLKHITDPVPILTDTHPELPKGCSTVIQKAMAKEPDDRYATAKAMMDALAEAIGVANVGEIPTAQRPFSPPPKPPSSTILPNDDPTVSLVAPIADNPTHILTETAPTDVPAKRGLPNWTWIIVGLFILGGIVGGVIARNIMNNGDEVTVTPRVNAGISNPTATPQVIVITTTADSNLLGETTTPQIIVVTATPEPTATLKPTNTPIPPTPTPTIAPIENGRIVFDSERNGNVEIYIMDADSTGQMRLTNNNVQDEEADLSSDSSQIVYASKVDNVTWQIYIMNSDGTDPQLLTTGRLPDWSPDDQFIAYETSGASPRLEIIEVDSGDIQIIPNNGQPQRAPSWSPDGERLVYMGQTDGVWQLFVVEMGSGNVTQITEGDDNKRFPVWSPDGTLIAYNTLTATDDPNQIWVVEPDGSNPVQLTDSGENGRPAWSPDSQFLLFNSDRNGDWQIYKMTRDGEDVTALTTFGGDQRPDWGVGE